MDEAPIYYILRGVMARPVQKLTYFQRLIQSLLRGAEEDEKGSVAAGLYGAILFG